MATAAPDAVPTTEPGDAGLPPTRRRRLWPRMLAGFALGLVLCLGLAAGALVAWDSHYQGRVLAGVHVGEVDLSGLDREQALAALHAAFDYLGEGNVVVETTAREVNVPYRRFGRRANIEAMVEEAMATGRGAPLVDRTLGQIRLAMRGQSIGPRLLLDADALGASVAEVLGPLDLAPIDARVVEGPTGIAVSPALTGRTFDAAGATAAALAIVGRLDAPDEVRVAAARMEIPPAYTDADALAVRDVAQQMLGRLVVTFRDQKWAFKPSVVRDWVTLQSTADGATRPAADIEAIDASLKRVAKGVRLRPQSAVYLRTRSGKVIGVAAGQDGRRLDRLATAAAIAQALTDRGHGIAVTKVKVVTEKVPPKLTTEEALKKGPLMVPLGTWKTWFPISERNYFGANIWLPAKIIDGTVLYPGRRFEWWSAIGPVTSGRGFGPGGFIRGDHTDPTGALGGGMCSSSTTLFNAALRAGLQMGARSNHRYYINRYPLGLDATVSKSPGGGGQTMSFTNDMKTPIVIRSFRYTAGGVGWVRYEIWGIPDGREVSLSRPSIANLRRAITRTVYVGTLPRGVREQVEYPADGMDVAVTRVVRTRNGRVIHRETYRTHYTLWNGLIEVGR
jgi:vancomycin resistance protein YoaR